MEIPTKRGCMHKADTYADDDQEQQPRPSNDPSASRAEQPRRALNFFQTGIYTGLLSSEENLFF